MPKISGCLKGLQSQALWSLVKKAPTTRGVWKQKKAKQETTYCREDICLPLRVYFSSSCLRARARIKSSQNHAYFSSPKIWTKIASFCFCLTYGQFVKSVTKRPEPKSIVTTCVLPQAGWESRSGSLSHSSTFTNA